MKALNSKQVLELLEKGATIEYTAWGLNPPYYIRLGETFERINQASFFSLRSKGKIMIVKRDRLDYIYKLTTSQLNGEKK